MGLSAYAKLLKDPKLIMESTNRSRKVRVFHIIFFNLILMSAIEAMAQPKTDTVFYKGSKQVQRLTEYFPKFNRVSVFNTNGQLEKVEEITDDRRNGMCLYYTYLGVLKEKTNYTSGKKNGLSIFYYDNGNKEYERHYLNDVLHGLIINYYPSSQLKLKEQYAFGHLRGLSERYYASGKRQSKGTYDTVLIAKKGYSSSDEIKSVLHGSFTQWYESGQVKSSGTFFKGKKNGECSEWFENGQLKTKGIYKLDDMNGEQVEYFSNGQLHFKYTAFQRYDSVKKFKQIIYEGEETRFTEAGQLEYSRTYKNGLPHGKWKEYRHGKLHSVNSYQNGLPVDSAIYYDNQGKAVQKMFYRIFRINGKDSSCLDGEVIDKGYEGIVRRRRRFSGGRCVYYVNYHINGKPQSETFLENNLVSRKEYFESGVVRTLYHPEEYKGKGGPESQSLKLAKGFYENGQLRMEQELRNGEVFITKKFNEEGNLTDVRFDLGNSLSFETWFYPTGKLKMEGIFQGTRLKRVGLQYVEWFENGNPKRLEWYSLLELNWLSDGTLHKSFGFERQNHNLPVDTVLSVIYVDQLYQVLKSSTQRSLNWDAGNGPVASFYGPGKPKIEAFLRNGYLDEYLRLYYYSGKPMIRMELKDGLLNGDYVTYAESGKVLEKGHFLNGKESGLWLKATLKGDTLEYYELAKPVEKNGNYRYKFRKQYFSEEDMEWKKPKLREYMYMIGDSILVNTTYHSNGNLAITGRSKNGKSIGPIRHYWLNGKVSRSCERDEKGRMQGRFFTTFQETDRIANEVFFKNDSLNGIANEYWPNGKLKSTGLYQNNLKNGTWLHFDSLGKPEQKVEFENGVKTLRKAPPGCHCRTIVDTKATSLLPLSEIVNLDRADLYQFAFHEPITSKLKNLYFRDYHFDSYQFNPSTSRLRLVAHSEIVTHLPDADGFEVVLNPCVSYQVESEIGVEAYITKYEPSKTKIRFRPEMLALRFKTRIMKPLDTSMPRTEAWFNVAELFYKESPELDGVKPACFTKSVVSGTKATLNLDSCWYPILGKVKPYNWAFYSTELLMEKMKISTSKALYGLVNGVGKIGSVDDPGLQIQVKHVMATNNFIIGEMVFDQVANPAGGSTFSMGTKSLSEVQLLDFLSDLFGKNATLARRFEKINPEKMTGKDSKLIVSFKVTAS